MSENEIQITTKGDQNLTNVVNAKYDLIMAAAAPNVKADGNWITRAKLELLAKPDVAALMTTKKGVESALVAIIRAATVGVNFGGTKPQAYFVPTNGEIRLDISQYGFCAAAVYGPGAVLEQIPELITVHQNDGIKIDQGTGTVIFPEGGIDPFADRGKLVGWVMRLVFKDNRQPEVKYVSFEKVRQVQDAHGNLNSPAYKKDFDQMDEKTAVKQMLKRVFAEAEGRSQMSFDELLGEPNPVIKDPETRMTDRMTRAAAGMKAAEPVAEIMDDEPPAHEPEKAEEKKDGEELF